MNRLILLFGFSIASATISLADDVDPYRPDRMTRFCRAVFLMVRGDPPQKEVPDLSVDENRQKIEEALVNARLPPWRHKAFLDGSSLPSLYRLADGTDVVLKKNVMKNDRVANESTYEVIGYSLDRFFDLGVVPPTVITKSGQVVQLFIPSERAYGSTVEDVNPVKAARINFLRRLFFENKDGIERLLDAKGNAWTIDFGLTSPIDPYFTHADKSKVLENLPDLKTFQKLKSLTKADYAKQFGKRSPEWQRYVTEIVTIIQEYVDKNGEKVLPQEKLTE